MHKCNDTGVSHKCGKVGENKLGDGSSDEAHHHTDECSAVTFIAFLYASNILFLSSWLFHIYCVMRANFKIVKCNDALTINDLVLFVRIF